MDPHRCPCCRPSRTPINGAVPRSPVGQEGYPVGTCLPTGVRVLPTLSLTRFLPMLYMHVARQRPERHILPSLRALYPTPLPLPVGSARSHHLSPVRRLRLQIFVSSLIHEKNVENCTVIEENSVKRKQCK